MNLNKLIQLTIENGGASLSINSGVLNPKIGFFASYRGSEFAIKLSDLNEASLLDYIMRNESRLRECGNFLGTWIDSNLVYLDISKQFSNEEECKQFAIENKQLAYYDAKNEVVKTLRKRL